MLLVLTVVLCTGKRDNALSSPHTNVAQQPAELRIHFFIVGVGIMALIECPAESLIRPILIGTSLVRAPMVIFEEALVAFAEAYEI